MINYSSLGTPHSFSIRFESERVGDNEVMIETSGVFWLDERFDEFKVKQFTTYSLWYVEIGPDGKRVKRTDAINYHHLYLRDHYDKIIELIKLGHERNDGSVIMA